MGERIFYGEGQFGLAFVRERDSTKWKALRDAVDESGTWSEFRERIKSISESDYEEWSEEVTGYSDEDEFSEEIIWPDGSYWSWPGYPAEAMLEWFPDDLADRYGVVYSTDVGDRLGIDAAFEKPVVEGLNKHGYDVVRHDGLIYQLGW